MAQSFLDLTHNPLMQAATQSRARSEGPESPNTSILPKYSQINANTPTPAPPSLPHSLTVMYRTCPLISTEPKKHGRVWKYYVVFSLPQSHGDGQVDGTGIYLEW